MSALPSVTGKAQFRGLRDALLADQLTLHREMDELEQNSRVASSPLYLQRHIARASGASIGNWRLRWRLKTGGEYRHVKWGDVQAVLQALPLAVCKHYEVLNRRVEEVNLLDILLQSQITWIERYLGLRVQRSAAGEGVPKVEIPSPGSV